MSIEAQIAEWRGFVRHRPAIADEDVEQMEAHLREQITALTDVGLSPGEAFLVAVKRMGSLDDISGEFAREHSERLTRENRCVLAADHLNTEAGDNELVARRHRLGLDLDQRGAHWGEHRAGKLSESKLVDVVAVLVGAVAGVK